MSRGGATGGGANGGGATGGGATGRGADAEREIPAAALRVRGLDVVISVVETYGRTDTEAQRRDLEEVPKRTIEYRGVTLAELDVDAIVKRAPQVCIVDELAHTNIEGSKNDKRWQDVMEILDAGINVISAVNIQHIESLNEEIKDITGVEVREREPREGACQKTVGYALGVGKEAGHVECFGSQG